MGPHPSAALGKGPGAIRFLTASTLAAMLLPVPPSALAQVAPGGLGTRVNGTALGGCAAGVCTVQGGTTAGRTLFHRFRQYDTRSGIQRVDLDTRGRAQVVVGVGHPQGSFFGAPLRLSGNAQLFWLSPGGIWFGSGGQIQGATSLLLSTAPTLRIGGGEFRAADGLGEGLSLQEADPQLDLEALARDGAQAAGLGVGDGPIVLAGGRLQVDRHLLLDSGAGRLRSVPGEPMLLQAGRSVQMRGGALDLAGLDVQASRRGGDGAEPGLVRLRSGTLPGGGLGRLSLRDSRLQGPRLLLEGLGGVKLERVVAGADAGAGPRDVQISAGTALTTASARLNQVSVRGGELLIRASGPLEASNLRAAAADGGWLQLEAGPAADGAASLRLEQAQLQGGQITVSAMGGADLHRVEVEASGARESSQIWLRSEAGGGGPASPLLLRNVALRSPRIALEATGDLEAAGLRASADTILLRSGGRLSLADGTDLRAEAPGGQIQLEALSRQRRNPQGRLVLEQTSLQSPTIIARADRALSLRTSTATAGAPGNRGLIQLETAPAADPPDGPGPGSDGEATLMDTSLTAQRLVLRSGRVQVNDSRIAAPKGQIHLEAKAGRLELSASRLDLGIAERRDLETPVNVRHSASGPLIDSSVPTPSIGLFAATDLIVRDGSEILASQDLSALRSHQPALAREQIRLTDTSGVVVLDAGHGLSIRRSRLEANASDNLAGNLLLRARAEDGRSELHVIDSFLSASGGAGSGDIRLTSNHGVRIDNTQIVANSTRSPEDPYALGQANWSEPISGGEITITNTAAQHAIRINNSQLRAEQTASGGLLRTSVLDGSDDSLGPLPFQDLYDDSDLLRIGGVINIISAGGMEIAGSSTRVSVDSVPAGSEQAESFGGTIRVVSFHPDPLQWQKIQPFTYRSAVPLDDMPLARSGELILRNPSLAAPPDDSVWGEGRWVNPYLLQPGRESEDQIFTGGAYPYTGGLPQEIKERVQRRQADMIFEPGRPARAIPPPASQREPQPFAAGHGAGVAKDSALAASQSKRWMAWPETKLTIPSAPPTLALRSAESGAQASGAALASTSQAMPAAAAAQTLQASDQAAAERIHAALGQGPRQPRRLDIAALQRELQLATRDQNRLEQPAAAYTPAILQISSTALPGQDQIQINHILVPARGEIKGWQTLVGRGSWQRTLERFRRQLSQADGLGSSEEGRSLSAVLLSPILPELERQGITALLLAPDRSLASLPFAALPLAEGTLLDRVAITISPALSLTDLDTSQPADPGALALLAGSSRFRNGLAPLPMAMQELRALAALHPGSRMLLDSAFRSRRLLEEMESRNVAILHLATHADFSGHLPEKGRIYTSDGELSLIQLGRELRRKSRPPIGLFIINGCRTAVGDEEQELGISGLALQANARSAVGNLWYVDDVVSAAFSVQFHRLLRQGNSKDQALRQTQLMFREGKIAIRDAEIVNDRGQILIRGLSPSEQRRLSGRLTHPYYWAGALLSGSPW
jgi:CHAT domain-containing protein